MMSIFLPAVESLSLYSTSLWNTAVHNCRLPMMPSVYLLYNTVQHYYLAEVGDWPSWVTDVTTLQGDWTGLLSFVPAVLLSTFILLFLLSSSVSLSNFYLAVPMRGWLGKHSCMSSPFPKAILNGTCSLRALILFCGDVPAIKTKLNKQTLPVTQDRQVNGISSH